MLQLIKFAFMVSQSTSCGIGFNLFWPTSQFAFGYKGTEAEAAYISSYIGSILIGPFELRIAILTVDPDMPKELQDLLDKISNSQRDGKNVD